MPDSSSLVDASQRLEQAKVALAEETFHQIIGLPFSPSQLEERIQQVVSMARTVREHPRADLKLAAAAGLEEILAERFNPRVGYSTLQRYSILSQKVQLNNKPVSLEFWTKLLRSPQGESAAVRQRVFDSFIAQTPKLTPQISTQLQRFKILAENMGTIVQDLYVRRYGISWDTLRMILQEIVESLAIPLKMYLAIIEAEILHRQIEYFDCPWTISILSDHTYDPLVQGREYKITQSLLDRLNIPREKTIWDATDRPNKLSSPLAWPVQIPHDIRLSYPPTLQGFNAFRGLLHEIGYTIFWQEIDHTLPITHRIYHSASAAQILPFLFATWLFCEGGFMHRFFQLNPNEVLQLRSHMLGNLGLWLIFDSIIALTKMDYWDDHLSLPEVDERFAQRYHHHMGIKMPGAYWQLLPLVPEEIIGREHSVVAAVILLNLLSEIRDEFGNQWLENPLAIKKLCTHLQDGGHTLLSKPPKLQFLLDLFTIHASK